MAELTPERGAPMSIELRALRDFQERKLEFEQSGGSREPRFDKIVEWALIEIVIQLTALKQSLQGAPPSQ